jgi:hypothetical protein
MLYFILQRGAAVPVIVPQDANKPLEFITNAEVREAAGVQRCNKYLFANRGKDDLGQK